VTILRPNLRPGHQLAVATFPEDLWGQHSGEYGFLIWPSDLALAAYHATAPAWYAIAAAFSDFFILNLFIQWIFFIEWKNDENLNN
jgi:hypothetical protein